MMFSLLYVHLFFRSLFTSFSSTFPFYNSHTVIRNQAYLNSNPNRLIPQPQPTFPPSLPPFHILIRTLKSIRSQAHPHRYLCNRFATER